MSSSSGAAFLRPPLPSSTSSPSPSQAHPHPHDDDDDDRILSLSLQDARTSLSSTSTIGNEHGAPFDSMSSGSARASGRSVDRARRQQQQQHQGEQDHDHEPAVAADSTNADITREDSSRAHLPPTIGAGSRPPPSSTTSPSATSPPPASSSSSAPSTSTRSRSTAANGPLRGIADMRTKTCWVCYEDSSDTPGREFVHACDCTLVAHTDCLLAWVTTDQLNKSTPAKCPVCATPYVIVQDRSTLLALYKRLRRRWHSLSIVLAGSGLVAAFGFVSAAWGAWAIKTFAGNQVARALLLRHERMPWRYWLNLPLIPLTLILARTPLIDSLLPFLPLTLVLSNHSSSSSSSLHPSQDPLGSNNLSLTYPPSPTLLLCALPWIRLVYVRLRRKVFKAVLGRRGQDLQGLAEMSMDLQEEVDEINAPQGAEALPHHPDHRRRGLGAARFQVVAEVQLEHIVQPEPGPEPAGGVVAPPPGAAGGGGGGGAAIIQNQLRLGFGRLTSLMVGTFLFPAICSTAGSGLFWLASKGGTQAKASWIRSLRHLLGVHTLLSSRDGPLSTLTRRTSWFSAILFPSFNSTFTTTTTPPTSSPLLDPIWLRNAYGGGIVLLVRDVLELMMGWFELKRDQSRRIVGRPFGNGLEFDQVEVEVEAAARGAQSAAGRERGTGREARVHNLL